MKLTVDPATFRRSRVTIEQLATGSGWRLDWGTPDAVEFHPTAADALRAVKDRDAVLARADVNCITIVEWTTYSPWARAVVDALTETR